MTIDKRKRYLFLVDYRGKRMPEKSASNSSPKDLLQGTLDLLVLKTLALEPMHGWGVAQRIQQLSRDVLQIGQGSLYPALHRLEYRGWIQAEWAPSENNRRAKFYSLTAAGRDQLTEEVAQWDRMAAAIGLVLGEAAS